MPKLCECLGFDLSYPLSSDVKVFANLFQRALFARLIEAKPHLNNFLLALGKGRQDIFRQLAQVVDYRCLGWIRRSAILYEARDSSLAVVANRRLQRNRLLRDL